MASTFNPSIRPAYTYSSLPDTGATSETAPHIRLLEVHDCNSDDPTITVSLHCTSMEDAPTYDAISYTWGDENDQEQIYVQHASSNRTESPDPERSQTGRMTVRKNCADVLRQLSHFKTSRYYWIDAICIDQQNLEEKNVQVWRMGDIYKSADSVLICLGMHDAYSRLVAATLEDFLSYFPKSDVHILNNMVFFEATAREKACADLCYEWMQSCNDQVFAEFLYALNKLAERPYFWRIWTLQERWASRRPRIFCGCNELHLPSLYFWWDLRDFVYWTNQEDKRWQQLLVSKLGEEVAATHESSYVSSDELAGRDVLSPLSKVAEGVELPIKLLSLSHWIHLCERCECQDRRDTVYGTLAIVDWNSMNNEDFAAITPNYNQSAFALARILMPRMSGIRDMNMLCRVLHLDWKTKEVRQGVELRSKPLPWDTSLNPIERPQRNTQNVVKLRMSGFRLGSPDIWCEPNSPADMSNGLTRIMGSDEGQTKGMFIACEKARDGDWLVIFDQHALVLREQESELVIIGKALSVGFSGRGHQYIMVWFDYDDLIIALCSREANWYYEDEDGELPGFAVDGEVRGNKELMSAWVNGRFCGKENSSFGFIPTKAELESYEGPF